MYFDGCASHLGCTVTLRGGSESELKKVTLQKQNTEFHVSCTICLHENLRLHSDCDMTVAVAGMGTEPIQNLEFATSQL